MIAKTLYLLVILTGFYTSLIIDFPSEKVKALGYNHIAGIYAQKIAEWADYKILHYSGLRKLNFPLAETKIKAVLPGSKSDYGDILTRLLADKCGAIIECSDLDYWHTTDMGLEYLAKIREQAYRIVVFDGGHHLPTIGLEPDIIIVPELAGYAVHSYMLDGIKVKKIIELVKDAGVPTMIVSVPRWALVKNEKSLVTLAQKILQYEHYTSSLGEIFAPQAAKRISKYNGKIFAYINKEYSDDVNLFLKRLDHLKIQDINMIYLAFDYKCINKEAAQAYSAAISEITGIKTERVNEPVKTAGVLWSER